MQFMWLGSSEGMLLSTMTLSFQFHLPQSVFPTPWEVVVGGGGGFGFSHQCDKPCETVDSGLFLALLILCIFHVEPCTK